MTHDGRITRPYPPTQADMDLDHTDGQWTDPFQPALDLLHAAHPQVRTWPKPPAHWAFIAGEDDPEPTPRVDVIGRHRKGAHRRGIPNEDGYTRDNRWHWHDYDEDDHR